jgi:hypothetical protein
MKAETRVLDYESTVQGDRVAMSIDESALSHIMSVLTDLYSDPELAVIREYATNALDAHTQAGVSRPIEVTLPSPLSPFFKIRDYGDGLDAADIRDVFSRYGTSTKRESNDVVGMLGLGCKSALTYADQFTLTGIKAGRVTQVLISRDEDGSGSMTIVAEHTADNDETGVEIVVPAKRGDAFATKARDFFRYWNPGTVLVNGEAPERIDGLWLSDSLLLTRDADADKIVMGNVPYPFLADADRTPANLPATGRYRLGSGYDGAYRIVAFVDIGEVSFTPSREALQGTKRTRARLAELIADVGRLRDAAVIRQVADAPSATDAIRILLEGVAVGFKDATGAATYKGRAVCLRLDRTPAPVAARNGYAGHVPDADDRTDSFLSAARYAKVKGERTWKIELDEDCAAAHYFEGFDGKNLTPTKRAKIASYLETRGLAEGAPLYFADRFTADEKFWLDGAPIRQWSDVDAIELPRAPRDDDGNARPRGSYAAIVNGVAGTIDAAEIDTSAPLYWVHGNEYSIGAAEVFRHGALDRARGTYVALAGGRIEKFKRDFPMAVEFTQGARDAALAWEKSIPPADLRAWRFQRAAGFAPNLCGLDAKRVSDPMLASAIRLASRDVTNLRDGFQRFGLWLAHRPADETAVPESEAFAPYPLLAERYNPYTDETLDHFYLYVNAAYAGPPRGRQSKGG